LGNCQVMWHPHKYGPSQNEKIGYTKINFSPKHFPSFADLEACLRQYFHGGYKGSLNRFEVSRIDIKADMEPVAARHGVPDADKPAVAHTPTSNFEGKHFKLCTGNWPPSYFIEPGSEPQKFTGVVHLFLESISKKAGFSFSTDLLPWRRCLREISSESEYALTPVVTWNEEWSKTNYYTRPIAYWQGLYFYRKEQYPSGPKITKASDLNKFRLCGRVEYNYEMYGVPEDNIECVSKSIENLVLRLLADRCDLFLARDANASGEALLFGKPSPFENPKIGYKVVPGMEKNAFYLMINKRTPNSKEFVTYLNSQIEEAWKSGEMDAIVKKVYGDNRATYGRPDF
jgi:polar amino acid transport system substrate-binding protein